MWCSALSCNILIIKPPNEVIDEVGEEYDTVERDEDAVEKYFLLKFEEFKKFVAFVYYKHYQLTVTFWRAYLYMFWCIIRKYQLNINYNYW